MMKFPVKADIGQINILFLNKQQPLGAFHGRIDTQQPRLVISCLTAEILLPIVLNNDQTRMQ